MPLSDFCTVQLQTSGIHTLFYNLFLVVVNYTVAVVDCTHAGAATASFSQLHCCCCGLYPCRGSYSFFQSTTLLLLWTVPMQGQLQLLSVNYTVAVVDCTHAGAATASFRDLVTVAQENSTNQTADILLTVQL